MNLFVFKFCFITLILCFFKVSKATESVDITRDFKTLLMYFSESFLKGAVFDGKALEGDNPINVAQNLVEAMEIVENEYPAMPDLEELVLFKKQLAAGIPIAQEIFTFDWSQEKHELIKSLSIKVQENFLAAMERNGGVVMPSGWVGHALYLVMRKGNDNGTVDFAFVNTGQGLQYHYHSADPNGVYPKLSQIWMEFKGVKVEELFTDEAWFFYGLIALKSFKK